MRQTRIILFLVLALWSIGSMAADGELITEQIAINVDKPGTLPDMIGESKKYAVTNLKLRGQINGKDINFIREMAGGWTTDEKADANLSILDMSEVRIVDGEFFFCYDDSQKKSFCVYSRNNVVESSMFYECSSLVKIVLPATVVEIREKAFAGCSKLSEIVFGDKLKSIGKSAFAGCSSISSITMTKRMEKIDDSAFENCSRLSMIRMECSIPPLLGRNVFAGCDGNTCHFTVPHGSYGAYWLSAWGDCFTNITERNDNN